MYQELKVLVECDKLRAVMEMFEVTYGTKIGKEANAAFEVVSDEVNRLIEIIEEA